MPDELTNEQPTNTEQQPATPAGAQNPEQQPADNTVPYSRFDEVNKAKKAAEAELAKLRKQAEDAEKAKLAETQQFQTLYEAEQAKAASLEKRLADMEAETKRNRIRAAIEGAARSVGFAEPADAYLFIDMAGVEVAEDGTVKDVEAKVKELAKGKPYLLAQRTPAQGNGARPPASGVTKGAEITPVVDVRKLF